MLPNRPPLGVDYDYDDEGGAMMTFAAPMMAACPDTVTAPECLNSGRWTANHI
jgi:hypothetical protein